jgi:hypothetical protein
MGEARRASAGVLDNADAEHALIAPELFGNVRFEGKRPSCDPTYKFAFYVRASRVFGRFQRRGMN